MLILCEYRDVCRYILFSTQSRKPVQKKDLSAIIRKANIKSIQDVIDEAKRKLSQGFGFDLIEAPNKSSYFVVVKKDERARNDAEQERQQQLRGRLLNLDENLKRYRGLISVVLQLLILHGNKCEKDILNHQLFDRMDTSCFGSQKQIIQDLKQQKWIEEEKEPNDERIYYRLGPRVNIETLSEWQYIAAFELVNGMRPPNNDRALQRITKEKEQGTHKHGRGGRARSGYSQRRGRGRGKGRRR